jgi:hypothetical protein
MSMNQVLSLRKTFRYGQISPEQYATELVERNAAWKSLTPEAQLADLDRRLGVGQGATRQRKLIAARIEKAKQPIVPVVIAGPGVVAAPKPPSKRAPNDKKGRK